MFSKRAIKSKTERLTERTTAIEPQINRLEFCDYLLPSARLDVEVCLEIFVRQQISLCKFLFDLDFHGHLLQQARA